MKRSEFSHRSYKLFLFFVLSLMSYQSYAISFGDGRLPDFTKLVEDNSPAVVNISTTQKVKRKPHHIPPGFQAPDIPEDSPFGDLLRRFFGEEGGGQMEDYESQSLGSGFVIDADGYIVTNNHVIREADEIIVRMSDRREFKAELVGTDPRSDIALLKIDATELPVIKIGSSADLKVGEWVMAIGTPFGFDHSVSAGIVSAIGRNLPSENYVPFIQTDVAINPGNSGGPLFNLDGKVVGINSQIYSRTGGFMGLSFAIPVDVAMDVVRQLKKSGKVSRGWLGILIQDVNRELAESFNMKQAQGAVVLKVLPDSPASKAGFMVGDVVVTFNGKKIIHSSDLPLAVGRTPIDSKAKVTVIREGKEKTLSVTIAELPTDEEITESGDVHKQEKVNRLGLVVDEVSPELREQLGLDKRGVLVRKVQKGPAKNAGIRSGDVILMMDNQKVTGLKQFKKLIKDLPDGKSIAVLIQRGKSPVFIPLRIPE